MVCWQLTPSARLTIAALSVAGGSGFLIYSNSVLNNLQLVVQQWLNETHALHHRLPATRHTINLQWAFVMASKEVGKIIGTLMLPLVAETCGRRGGLMLNCAVTIIGCLLCFVGATAYLYEVLIVGRLLVGMGIICGVGLASLFLIEAAPTQYRGWSASLTQIFRGFGCTMGLVFSLPEIAGTAGHWHLCLAVPAIPAAVQFAVLLACSESPRHLYITKHRKKQAVDAILFYMGAECVETVVADLEKEKDKIAAKESLPFLVMISRKEFVLQIALTILLLTNRALTGIMLVQSYSTDMFMSAGLRHLVATKATVLLGIIHMVSAIIVTLKVEHYGRKTLLLWSNAATMLFLAGIGVFAGYPALPQATGLAATFLALFMAVYPVVASISNIVASEICHQRIRSRAFTVGLLAYSAVGFLSAFFYPTLKEHIGIAMIFLPYCVSLLLSIIVYSCYLPETRGKSLGTVQPETEATSDSDPSLLKEELGE